MRNLSDAQLGRLQSAADANDPILYYELLSEYGFGYGKLALEVVTDTGIYGRIANNFLRHKLAQRNIAYTEELRDQLISELMMADLAYRKSEDIVTVINLAEYHKLIFDKLGLPREAWTGAFLDDRGAQALFCPTCSDAELAGHSRLSGAREVWGDVIDDLTDEVFDLGSGPSEGAAKGAAEFMEDLFLDGVVPQAVDDELSYRIQELYDRTFGRSSSSTGAPSRHLFHDSSFRSEDREQQPVSTNLGGGEHLVQMSIAPGQTRTATINLPGLTLEIEVTMPR